MEGEFFVSGQFRTGANLPTTFLPVLSCVSAEQFEGLAQKYASEQEYYDVRAVRPGAANLVKALRKFRKKESKIIIVADIYVSSGQAMRKAYTRAYADMDRGILKKGHCAGFAIFQLERNAPNFCSTMFRINRAYQEN